MDSPVRAAAGKNGAQGQEIMTAGQARVKSPRQQTPVPGQGPAPAGRGLGTGGRFLMGSLFLVPLYAGVSLLRLSPGAFTIETVGFLAYRCFPAAFLLLSLVLGGGWILARRPPRLATLTLASAAVIHGLAGLLFFPQTYSILVLPIAAWAGAVFLLVGRIDWVELPPLYSDRRDGPVYFRRTTEGVTPCPGEAREEKPAGAVSQTPAAVEEAASGPDSEAPEAIESIQERFDRLREELRPRPRERVYPQPSPLFLGVLALIGGVLSAVLLLPSAPSSLPLYGQQSEGFEAEPLWDPLLLAPERSSEPEREVGELRRVWAPQSREPELPEAWEDRMKSDSIRAVFSKRSALIRVESPGCVANVEPLMGFSEVSADGFALLPWNRGSLAAGSATGWQIWTSGDWTAWVRYSGDPFLEGAWPPKARQGVGPWLGKVALQLVEGHGVVGMASVNRLNLALSARQADLCSISIEPIREATVRWGTVPDLTDYLTERSQAWLHRTASHFVRNGQVVGPKGAPARLESEIRPRFQGWLIVRQPGKGPGFLVCCPFWQRQIGIERSTHTPINDPSNRVSVAVEGLTTHIRFSLLAAQNPHGSTVATLAPGTYLNTLLLVPIQDGEPDETALNTLRHTLRVHAPPLLVQETRDFAEGY